MDLEDTCGSKEIKLSVVGSRWTKPHSVESPILRSMRRRERGGAACKVRLLGGCTAGWIEGTRSQQPGAFGNLSEMGTLHQTAPQSHALRRSRRVMQQRFACVVRLSACLPACRSSLVARPPLGGTYLLRAAGQGRGARGGGQ